MDMPGNLDIALTVWINGEKRCIMTRRGEYRNLMMLLYDKFYIEDFGECKGTGRCGTCHIHILNPIGELLNKEGNETTTLDRMGPVRSNSRLACQILIDEKLNGPQIEVV
jgi:ferredoxin, 2Fe-2S